MWRKFSSALLRNRITFTSVIMVLTVFMGWEALQMELSYEFAKILPDSDSTFIDYKQFRSKFGEDGTVLVMGFEDKDLFKAEKIGDWYEVSQKIKAISGIKDILSLPTAYGLKRNDSLMRFDTVRVMTSAVTRQTQADSLREALLGLPFYEGLILNKESGATLMAITFKKEDLNSARRITMVKEITDIGDAFGKKHNLEMHYSGMPFVRAAMMSKVSKEMTLFLVLAICVTGLILWLFFRTISTVLVSLVVVAIGVVWSIGIMQLFGYKITVLSGLVAPLIMVIGVPNCIFLINKYQREILEHGNRLKALSRTIETIGVTLFLANITTAIGFAVLYFTQSSLLVEFGVVASISVLATYFVTLILIPVLLSILPMPSAKHTKHQDNPIIGKSLTIIDNLVQNHRPMVYIITTVLTLLSIWGMTFIDMNGYVVDDLPKKDKVYTDLAFFEKHFKGVLPFEISIDTKVPNGVFADNAKTLYKIKRLQGLMAEYPEFSKPLSLVEAIKFGYQAYRDGDPKYYRMPAVDDLKKLQEFVSPKSGSNERLKSFIDTARQVTRVSYQAADIGSKRMKVLMAGLRPRIDSIFDPAEYDVNTTGHSLVFLKSNDYLLSNLIESLVIEIVLIALVGIALFRSVRIIVLSKLPCLIPLVITAGVMGFLDIRFKPSTILIFSIAFGISSDGTIYFLTRYRQELMKRGRTASRAISEAIHDTGRSMIYTSVILFCGFSIFAASSFGGTVALGILVSLTLLMSMFTNLILLPAILLSIHSKTLQQEITAHPLVDMEEEETRDI
jgi:predicted RND superfamily exporter protein